MAADPDTNRPVFVTGATGYIGGRLVPALLERGHRVRCFARSPGKLAGREWAGDPRVEIVSGDLFDKDISGLITAMAGCGPAYYLVHSMLSAGSEYVRRDREMAERFARAAAEAGLERIVYLGGLGELGDDLSAHLSSRREVGAVLASGPVPVTELRAAMIIGSGSASFETLRYLVERLPVMTTPKWVQIRCQPIAVRNVITYLTDCIEVPETYGRVLDIGGPDIMTYTEIMQIMAEERGLRRRLIIPVPVLTPWLSSLWIHLVTPISADIARPLAEGLRNEVVCRDGAASELMPQDLLSIREAIRVALESERNHRVPTTWSMAGPIPGDPDWAGGTTFREEYRAVIDASPEHVFRAVGRVGGGHGWYAADWLWRIRGLLDRLVGGPGLRRGRRDPERIAYGEALDFWRVTGLEENRDLRLRAEMKLPGEALLGFHLEPVQTGRGTAQDQGTGDSVSERTADQTGSERTELVQTALFKPRGLFGLLYWYALYPLHKIIFGGMIAGIRRTALQLAAAGSQAADGSAAVAADASGSAVGTTPARDSAALRDAGRDRSGGTGNGE